jgi:transposase InsO family protein
LVPVGISSIAFELSNRPTNKTAHRRPTPTRTLTDTWPSQTHSHAADGHRLSDAIFDYIEGWYNTRRLYSYLGYLSPAQYESLIHQVG